MISSSRIAEVLAEFEAFEEECERTEYTDTGQAWHHMSAMADALRGVVVAS